MTTIDLVIPRLILIMGLPATGKTTVSRRLAEELTLPLIAKDEIKEMLFDGLGCRDREWSKKLGGMSFDLLYWSIEKILNGGSSLVVDADFSDPDRASKRLQLLRSKLPFQVLKIELVAEGEILYERFRKRSLGGDRHPGHVDLGNFEEFKSALLMGRREPLELTGELLMVDTTDFEAIPYERIVGWIRDRLSVGVREPSHQPSV